MSTDRIRDIRLLRELMLVEHERVCLYGKRLLCVFTLGAGAKDDLTYHKQNLIPDLSRFTTCSLFPARGNSRALKRNKRVSVTESQGRYYSAYVDKAINIPHRANSAGWTTTLYLYGLKEHCPLYATVLHMTYNTARIYSIVCIEGNGIAKPLQLSTVCWQQTE